MAEIKDRKTINTKTGTIILALFFTMSVSKYIIRPDITFILDVDPKIAVERINSRGKNITSYENIEFLRKVRENFLKLKEIFPEDNIIYIDGEEKPEEILEKILNIIEKGLIIILIKDLLY